jgi:hypothetical protein
MVRLRARLNFLTPPIAHAKAVGTT